MAGDAFRFGDGAAEDISASAAIIAGLDCDVLLSPHPFLFRMSEKLEQGGNAFIDGDECIAYAESALQGLERRLALESEREDRR